LGTAVILLSTSMTFEEWLIDVNGEYVEVAGSANAKNQCVDSANDYIKRVLGLPIIEWTNACDFPSKAGNNFDWIPNDEIDDVPEPGDLPIWGNKVGGGAGHIDVCIEKGNQTNFKGMDQNWPVGSPCRVVTHTYANVIGWLRPKINNSQDEMTEEQKRILQFLEEQKANEGKVREAFGALADSVRKDVQIQTLQERVLSLESSQKGLEDRLMALESDIKANQDLVADWQSKYQSANKRMENISEQLEAMTSEKNKFKGYYEKALDKAADKLSAMELFKLLIQRITKK
jgi:hypothetical protein